jgi:hypothetical protein
MTPRIAYRVFIRLLAIPLIINNLGSFTWLIAAFTQPGAFGGILPIAIHSFSALVSVGIPLYLLTAPKWLERKIISYNPDECEYCGYNLTGLPDAGRCPECGWHYENNSAAAGAGLRATGKTVTPAEASKADRS